MRRPDGSFVCDYCGATVDVARDAEPYFVLVVRSTAPAMHALYLSGVELHSCPASDPARPPHP